MTHKYLTLKDSEKIPLTFKTNEETGELLPVNDGQQETISDVVSITGSVVNINTRNADPYNNYYQK